MWTAATTACFPSSCCFCKVGNVNEQTHPSATCSDLPRLLLHNSFQDGFPGFFPHICLVMQVTTCESCPLERVIIIIIIGVLFCFFPCSSKPLWVVSRAFWGCQSSLLAKKSPPRMFPHDMKASSPKGLEEAHAADLQLPPVCSRVPRRIRQGWANSRSSFEGPAVLWYSRAQGSHIISANITVARHLSSSVSFVHKTSFCSIRFNRHLLNICAVSDHVQGARTAKMNNRTGTPCDACFPLYHSQSNFSGLRSSQSTVWNPAVPLLTRDSRFTDEEGEPERPGHLPKIMQLINGSSDHHNTESWFVSQCSILPCHLFFFPWHIAFWHVIRGRLRLLIVAREILLSLLIILHYECHG